MRTMMQSAIGVLYPNHCATCDTPVARQGGLCSPCWREMPFIEGSVCDTCGAPVQGPGGLGTVCDDCAVLTRPWDRGRAAVLYKERGREVVLRIKHADRLELVPAASAWLAAKVADLRRDRSVLVPVPSHWKRVLTRRCNQAALLARGVARLLDVEEAPRALVRTRPTSMQENKTRCDRFEDLRDSMVPHRRHGRAIAGRHVILIDDVMTSGATLAAATDAAFSAGADRVDVAILARVVQDP